MTVKRKALPKGTQRQQGSLNGSRTLDVFLLPRNQPLTERSHGAESVSSPSLSNGEGGSLNVATAGQGKVKPTRKVAQKRKGYYVEQATFDKSDVDEPEAPVDSDDFSLDDYVIFEFEDICFPGKVTKVHTKTGSVTVSAMAKFDLPPSSWMWPVIPNTRKILISAIKQKIKAPLPLAEGDIEHHVVEMAFHGW